MPLRPGHNEAMTGGENEPWVVRDAISFLGGILDPKWVGIEWGAGSSTPWYAARLNQLTSIEHDPVWACCVIKEMTAQESFSRWQMRFVPSAPEGHPAFMGSGGRYYSRYVYAARDVQMPSFIAIDGRARSVCLDEAVRMIQPLGAILLDNSEREEYQAAIARVPSSFDRLDFTNGEWSTTIWRKPR
jgi:hypothetical protein